MPGKVKVRIVSARGLPVMDRSSDLADAFAEVEFKKQPIRFKISQAECVPPPPLPRKSV